MLSKLFATSLDVVPTGSLPGYVLAWEIDPATLALVVEVSEPYGYKVRTPIDPETIPLSSGEGVIPASYDVVPRTVFAL